MADPGLSATNFTVVQIDGQSQTQGAETIIVLLRDQNGDILWAVGTTVPTDATTGYAKGCLFIDTDVATGTTGLNCNKGTKTSCQFTAITQA